MGEFGDKFRKEREKKGISLEDVSNETKISSRMLRAIEDEQFDRLPGGVFNKGFIRAYAKHIGLNEDQAVADYLACLRESEPSSQDVWDPQAGLVDSEEHAAGGSLGRGRKPPAEDEELPNLQLPRAEHVGPPSRYGLRRERDVSWRLLALALLVVVLAVLVWQRHSREVRTQAAAKPPATSAAQPALQPVNPPVQTATAPPVVLRAASAAAPARLATSKTTPTPSSSSSGPSLNPAVVRPVATAEANGQKETADSAVLPGQTGNPPVNPASVAPAELNLIIRASENSWVSVSADGRSVLHELLIAPAHTTIHANREIVLRIGNSAGVSFVWNGQELPAQGAEAEVKTLVFDANGMREVTPVPMPRQDQ